MAENRLNIEELAREHSGGVAHLLRVHLQAERVSIDANDTVADTDKLAKALKAFDAGKVRERLLTPAE